MISRLNLLGSPGSEISTEIKTQPRRSYLSGWFMLGALTTFYLAWIVIRWLVQPVWPGTLPDFLREISELVEVAAAVTLLFLWAGLLWRHFRRQPTHMEGALKMQGEHEPNRCPPGDSRKAGK